MANLAVFQRYWMDWERRLKTPASRNQARLRYPSLIEHSHGGTDVTLKPDHPICLYNVPQKASSSKGGLSHRQVIFIDGAFTIKDAWSSPQLLSGRCSASLFSMERSNGGIQLTEVEALHFDMDSTSSPTPYHPTFHVQRDISNRLSDERVREGVHDFNHDMPVEKIVVNRFVPSGAQHLRLPTPQMDMFAVFTMVVADFFCNGGDADPRIRAQFKDLLDHLTNSNNLAREGLDAQALKSRAKDAHTCPAHWYPEYV